MACPTNQKMNVEEATPVCRRADGGGISAGVLRDRSDGRRRLSAPRRYRKETLDHLLGLDTRITARRMPRWIPAAPTFQVKMARASAGRAC